MKRHVISILVENQAGVLSRITGLFSRRGFNIESLSVGVTEQTSRSRITVMFYCDDNTIEQIKKQVQKLIDVIHIIELKQESSVFRELILIKIHSQATKRSEIIGIVDVFRANIIDLSKDTITVELTGDQDKINAFCDVMEPYGIIEIARCGLTGLSRGSQNIKNNN